MSVSCTVGMYNILYSKWGPRYRTPTFLLHLSEIRTSEDPLLLCLLLLCLSCCYFHLHQYPVLVDQVKWTLIISPARALYRPRSWRKRNNKSRTFCPFLTRPWPDGTGKPRPPCPASWRGNLRSDTFYNAKGTILCARHNAWRCIGRRDTHFSDKNGGSSP